MKIDMHVHTIISSPCSNIDIHDMIDYAQLVGLDALCVTDHDTLYGARLAQEIGREKNFTVFKGMEVNTYQGDFLVFGLKEDIGEIVSAQELIGLVEAQNGVAIAAHPFRQFERALGDNIYTLKGYHAIETKNGNTPRGLNYLAEKAAVKLNLPGVGGSDAHLLQEIGMYYTEFEDSVTSEEELVEALKEGSYLAKSQGFQSNSHSWEQTYFEPFHHKSL